MKKSITRINPKGKKQEKKHFDFLLYIQLFLTITLLIFGIVTLFKKDLYGYFELLLAVTILDMGLNNQIIYKRAYLTIFYIVIGLILFGLGLFHVIGG